MALNQVPAAASPQTLLTTTGDTLYASAANTPVRLGVGTNGQYLTTNGTIPSWGTISAGGWTLLASGNVGSSGVNLTGIAGNSYQELVLRVRDCIATADGIAASMTVNDLSGASDYKYIRSGLTTANSLDASSSTYFLNYIAGSSTNYGGVMYIKFLNPASGTGSRKQITSYSYDTNSGYRLYTWGDVNSSAQISSINFVSNNLTSGTYALYGVK
jgi:hypothetical protein